MHPYSLDTHSRRVVYFFLGIGAFTLPTVFMALSGKVLASGGVAYPISVGATFTILHTLFDHFLWRKLIFIFKIPDLNGRWRAEGVSSYKDEETGEYVKFSMEYTIKQTFTHMEIFGETGKSTSRSTMASIELEHVAPVLRYSFENTPKNTAEDDLHRHPGLIELRIPDSKSMEGGYFSGKHRLRYGELNFVKL